MKRRLRIGRKTQITLGVIIVLVLAVRALAPGLILKKLNEALATMSPHYTAHIDDLDIHLWRMAYSFDGIQVRQVKPDREILHVREVDVSLAWRELLEWRIVTDIRIEGADLKVDQPMLALMNERKGTEKENADKAKKSLIPFRIEKLVVTDSKVTARDLPQIPIEQALRVSEIEATLRNLIPSKSDPQTDFVARARVMNDATFRAEGDAQLGVKPPRYDVEARLKNFELGSINQMLSRMVPLTVDRGTVDAYAVVHGQGAELKGSVIPYGRNLEFIGDRRDFKGLKHGLIEMATAVSSWILENRKEGTVATQVDFQLAGGNFTVDVRKAIDEALKHRFEDPIKPSELN